MGDWRRVVNEDGVVESTRALPARVVVQLLLVALAATAIRLPWLTQPGYLIDQQQFFFWGYLAAEHGLSSVYDTYEMDGRTKRWCNYPPLYVHVLRVLAWSYPHVTGRAFDVDAVRAMSYGEDTPDARAGYALFKLPAVLADVLAAVLLTAMLLHARASPWAVWVVGLAYAVHPAVVHDSTIWGQVDAIHALLMVLSLAAALRRRLVAMTAWAVLALLAKPQALLLGPIWLVAFLVYCREANARAILRQVLLCGLTAIVLVAVVAGPFSWPLAGPLEGPSSGLSAVGSTAGLYDAYFKAVGYYPYVHLNGFSLWFLANPLPGFALSFAPYLRDDVPWVLGLTARTLGMTALACVWLAVGVRLWRRRCDDASMRWAAAVLPLAFFLLPTQIHERYLVPALALGAWGYWGGWRWWVGWLVVGGCCWLNAVWVFPGPAESAMAHFAAEHLHGPTVGPGIGIVCSVAMLIVLVSWLLALRPSQPPEQDGQDRQQAREAVPSPGTSIAS